jgi:hypothetical protein
MKVARLSAYTPAAFTPRKYSWYSFLLEAELTPRPQWGQKDYVKSNTQEMYKTMEPVVKDTHFFIITELDNHLPAMQLVSFLEQTDISSKQSLVDCCITLCEEHLLVD